MSRIRASFKFASITRHTQQWKGTGTNGEGDSFLASWVLLLPCGFIIWLAKLWILLTIRVDYWELSNKDKEPPWTYIKCSFNQPRHNGRLAQYSVLPQPSTLNNLNPTLHDFSRIRDEKVSGYYRMKHLGLWCPPGESSGKHRRILGLCQGHQLSWFT